MSAQAFGNLDTRELARRTYGLLDDFWFNDSLHFGKITAKKSFITNYASIDVLLHTGMIFFYAFLASYGDKSATIHDWLYSGYGIERSDGSIYYPTRKECDQIFLRALRAEGVDEVRAWMFYIGVRIGGKSSFTATKEVFVV